MVPCGRPGLTRAHHKAAHRRWGDLRLIGHSVTFCLQAAAEESGNLQTALKEKLAALDAADMATLSEWRHVLSPQFHVHVLCLIGSCRAV